MSTLIEISDDLPENESVSVIFRSEDIKTPIKLFESYKTITVELEESYVQTFYKEVRNRRSWLDFFRGKPKPPFRKVVDYQETVTHEEIEELFFGLEFGAMDYEYGYIVRYTFYFSGPNERGVILNQIKKAISDEQ
jgi:hypothetical protein